MISLIIVLLGLVPVNVWGVTNAQLHLGSAAEVQTQLVVAKPEALPPVKVEPLNLPDYHLKVDVAHPTEHIRIQ